MDPSTVPNRQDVTNMTSSPSTRTRASQDYARQAAADDAVRQQRRAANNRAQARQAIQADLMKQITQEALKNSMEQERIRERQNMQAGVEKMVRTVVRKESAQSDNMQDKNAVQDEQNSHAQYVREKLNSTYSSSSQESPRDKELRPSPSERQQQRALENYQQSNRNQVDRTVELVV